MGWSSMAMPNEGARAYLDNRIYSWRNDTVAYQVLDSALVGNREYYAAVERIDLATSERTVFAGVALVRISKRNGGEFAYKGMSEDAEPFYYACPVRILRKLTDTANQSAVTWRAKSLEAAALRSTKGKGPKLADGQRVRFAEAIRFRGGAVLSEFDIERQLFSNKLVFIDPETRNRYRISGAQKRAHEILPICAHASPPAPPGAKLPNEPAQPTAHAPGQTT